MSTDLHARALTRHGLLEGAGAEVTDALALARDALHAAAGAAAALEASRGALLANQAQQAVVRRALADVTTAADAATFEDQLRELQIDEASLVVEWRHTQERVIELREWIARLGELAETVDAAIGASSTRVDDAKAQAERNTGLRAALTTAPVSTVVAEATSVLAGPAFATADARLDARLPSGGLRARAEARFAEARAVGADAVAARDRAQDRLDDLASISDPQRAAVAAAERRLRSAQAAMGDYQAGAAGRLEWAEEVLTRVGSLPNLSAAQIAAVDPANHPGAVTAKDDEADLATELAALVALRVPLDETLLDQLVADLDDTAAVAAARAALANPADEAAVVAARAAYDTAAIRALDEWEVEVPAWLWSAVEDFVAAKATLEDLADQPARLALSTELGNAEDELADALDDLDVHRRAQWALALAHADRAALVVAVEKTMADRRRHYVRGDGPSGRTVDEL